MATLPIPEPRRHEILVRVEVVGVCRTDVDLANGRRQPSKRPLTLGHECSGVVVERGVNARRVSVGERVAVWPWIGCGTCDACGSERPHRCGSAEMLGLDRHGAFAEFVVIPEYNAYVLGPNIGFHAGAYMEPLAAALAVRELGLSGRGLIVGRNRFSELVRRVLTHVKTPVELVTEPDVTLLAANAFDFAIETVPTVAVFAALVRALKPGGRLVMKSRPTAPVAIDVAACVLKELRCEAACYGSPRKALELLESGAIAVDDLVGTEYPLDAYGNAFTEAARDERRKVFFVLQT